jgi:hypothetical protein
MRSLFMRNVPSTRAVSVCLVVATICQAARVVTELLA